MDRSFSWNVRRLLAQSNENYLHLFCLSLICFISTAYHSVGFISYYAAYSIGPAYTERVIYIEMLALSERWFFPTYSMNTILFILFTDIQF